MLPFYNVVGLLASVPAATGPLGEGFYFTPGVIATVVLERFLRTLKEGEVYHQEYENHYQTRDGISGFIDYYNNRRPHQGIGFIAPYQKLTGQEERIFKERRAGAIAAQEIRKIENRRK